MIPNNENYDDELDEEFDSDFEEETEPSLTYAMKLTDEENEEDTFVGKVDDVAAIEQAILKLLENQYRAKHRGQER